eukprot:7339538-Prymnesium_polylepis.1
MLRNSITSKSNETDLVRIKKALKLIPKTHTTYDYIKPLIVYNDQSDRPTRTTFEGMTGKLLPVLREMDAENDTSKEMAFPAFEQPQRNRNERKTTAMHAPPIANKCNHCDLLFCKSMGSWSSCVCNPSTGSPTEVKDAKDRPLNPAKRSLLNFMRLYMKEKSLQSIKGVTIPDT